MLDHLGIAGQNLIGTRFNVIKEIFIEDDAILNDFGQSALKFAWWQCLKIDRVDPHTDRLVKCADEIFALGVIDANLATDRAVNHGKQCGGNHQEGNTTIPGGGDESREIANHSATQGNDQGFSVSLHPRENIIKMGSHL